MKELIKNIAKTKSLWYNICIIKIRIGGKVMVKKIQKTDMFHSKKVCNVVTCIHHVGDRCMICNQKDDCCDFYEKRLIQEN